MNSIRRHLALVLSVALTALFAAGGLLVWMLVRSALIDQFDVALLSRARILADNIEENDGALKIDKNLLEQRESEYALPEAVWIVLGPDGAELMKSSPRGHRHFPEVRMPNKGEPLHYEVHLGPKVQGRAVAMQFDADDDKKGLYKNLTLITALPAPEIRQTLRTLGWILLGAGVLTVVVLVPLLRTALHRGLRPLQTLAAETSNIDAGKLDVRLNEQGYPQELRPVAATLNALLERLEASFTRERRFSSDVAHELRTPVAELRSLGEMVTRWPAEATPAAFADVLAISREMEEVVNRLMWLSRADSGNQPLEVVDVDLKQLVEEVLERHSQAAKERNQELVTHLESVVIQTDPAVWKMIVTNLIGNAVAHAPASSKISIRLAATGLTIANPAPSLELSDLPKLFDRFWRKDSSRSGYGHSGLGLPLVHTLSTLLGAEPQTALTAEGELSITIPVRHISNRM